MSEIALYTHYTYFWSTFTLQHPLHVDKLVLDLDLSGLQHLLVQRIDGCAIPQIVPVLDELERVTRIKRAEELNLEKDKGKSLI